MPKLSPEAFAERRQNIMDAARRCFASRGMAVSVEEICSEAGISKGAFYGYFPSKDAAIEAIAGEHSSAIDSLATIDGCEALTDRLFGYARDGDPELTRLELEAWAHSLHQPVLRTIIQQNILRMRAALARSIDGQLNGADGQDALIVQVFSLGMIATIALSDGVDSPMMKGALRKLLTILTSESANTNR